MANLPNVNLPIPGNSGSSGPGATGSAAAPPMKPALNQNQQLRRTLRQGMGIANINTYKRNPAILKLLRQAGLVGARNAPAPATGGSPSQQAAIQRLNARLNPKPGVPKPTPGKPNVTPGPSMTVSPPRAGKIPTPKPQPIKPL